MADAREKLADFKPCVFQACITSPPYWGLRDYEVPNEIGAENRSDGTLWLNIGDAYTSGGRTWRAPRDSTILDPFFGTGTVGLVSKYLGRNCVGIEMKREFAEMAASRIESSAPKELLLPLS